MFRTSLLTLFLLAAGVGPATAGVMVRNDLTFDSMPSVDVVAELIRSSQDEQRSSVYQSDSDSCDWSTSNAHVGVVFAIALAESFVSGVWVNCTGCLKTINLALPPSPTLDGLLKPPKV